MCSTANRWLSLVLEQASLKLKNCLYKTDIVSLGLPNSNNSSSSSGSSSKQQQQQQQQQQRRRR